MRWYSHPSIKRIRWFKNRVIVKKTTTIIKPSNEELQLKVDHIMKLKKRES